MTAIDSNAGRKRLLRRVLWLFVFCGLLAVYLPTIALTVHSWSSNPYAGHAPFVPLFFLCLLWWDRDRLLHLRARPQRLYGSAVLFGALAMLVAGKLTDSLTLQLLSLVTALLGCVIGLLGTINLRFLAFPMSFLFLMQPLPGVVVRAISPHARTFATDFTSAALGVLQVPHYQQGTQIHLPNLALEIADGCNGLRFLAALFTLAVVFAQISQETPLRKLLLAASSVPLAVLANAMRVAAITAGVYYIGPHVADGLTHHSIGKALWLLTLVPLGLLAYALRSRADRSTVTPYGEWNISVISHHQEDSSGEILPTVEHSTRGDHVH